MKKLICICFLIMSLLVACSDSKSTANPHVESLDQIAGCWEMIVFSEETKNKMNEIDPWPAKYQWFCFSAEGSLKTMSSSVADQNISTAGLQEIFARVPHDIECFIPEPGVIITKQLSVKQDLGWLARFMGAPAIVDGIKIEEGTLVMSLYSEKENKTVYSRFLKRMD